ncbi:hypothetical protein [Clostridium beijerinckii]|uniref:hypothetical protein n=1 Tax=Clostridium beijerinckii TaxID=1520 RepID=UPI0009D3B7B6|nr:hypothetical protein [Clostridium beijerinckii]NRT76342.1 hypothetical protein [Clostridium beijerinckii]OOM48621.1 hypothetical protein CBEIJ_20930 [Clostridium beijerinckii]
MLDKKKLEIAKETAEIKLNDPTGVLTIEAALRQAQSNRLDGPNQIIKNVRGDEDD